MLVGKLKEEKIKYWPLDRVYIPELELWGTVDRVMVSLVGYRYEVRFFMSGDLKEVWFTAGEIQSVKQKSQ